MSRYKYYPYTRSRHSLELTLDYSMKQYNTGLRALHDALDGSARSLELAILGSIVFIAFEVLWGADMKVKTHMEGASSVLVGLTKTDLWYSHTYSQCLVNALEQLHGQISLLGGFSASIGTENGMARTFEF